VRWCGNDASQPRQGVSQKRKPEDQQETRPNFERLDIGGKSLGRASDARTGQDTKQSNFNEHLGSHSRSSPCKRLVAKTYDDLVWIA
jgi:hypothetical protein